MNPQSIDITKNLPEIDASVNEQDKFGLTPLHYATRGNSDIEAIKYLFEQGAIVNTKDKAFARK